MTSDGAARTMTPERAARTMTPDRAARAGTLTAAADETELFVGAGMLDVVDRCTVSPVMIGRADQLAALDEACAAAAGGQPTTVLVGGEAGIGKSRLVEEFGAWVTRGGGTVLSGGCLELGASGLPFAPFTAVLRQLVRALGAGGVGELLAAQPTQELARLLPELGQPARYEDETYHGEARGRLFEQMLVLLEGLAKAGPVALIIEDAHWADRSTRDLLTFLIRNQGVLRGLLIVVTFRSDELHRTHPLRPLLAELGRIGWVRRLELPRLSRHEAAEQMATILAGIPEPGQVERVYRRSEGNPLFVEQLLCCDGELPDSLRELVLANVQRLPEQTTELLRVASVSGARVGHALLAEVSGLADEDLMRSVRPAVAGNVVIADSDGYRFRHAMIAEVMHDDLLPGEHSRLHARFAEAIANDASLVPADRAAVVLAHHWYAAHDVTWALISAWQAAAAAGRAVAYAEQLDMLSRVLELWEKVPDAAQRIGADHVRVLEEAASITYFTGDSARGQAFATAALDELDVEAEPTRAALLLKRRSQLRCMTDPVGAVADVRHALQLVSDGMHERERAAVLASLAQLDQKEHGYASSRAAAEEALTIAKAIGDLATQANALITLAMQEPDPGPAGQESALAMLAEARLAASLAPDYHLMMSATISESHLLEGMGEHLRAAEVAGAGLAETHRYGLSRTDGPILAINQAEPLAALGRWDEAMQVIGAGRESSAADVRRSALWQLAADIALATGDLAGAIDAAEVAVRLQARVAYRDQNHLPVARLQIDLLVAKGELAAALLAAEAALKSYDLQASPRYSWPLLVAGVRAAADVAALPVAARDDSDADQAVALLTALRAEAAKLDVIGPLQAAHELTFLAEAARTERATGPADVTSPGARGSAVPSCAQLWQQAAAAWDALGEPYPRARALLREAEAELAAGERSTAERALAVAADLAHGLGAAPLLGEIELLARRARIALAAGATDLAWRAGRPTSPGGPSVIDRFRLTPRECEVLRLVADGLSNGAIADQLFISTKTASVHVSNILAKLGAASRGEAAALAHRLKLLDVTIAE
jgi:DNA-binding CsgD family transcriptional regulator